ncbi:hypothetical protein [Exiguobacterium sp. UBA5002]|uniref:hypothetical protein n=1 Tax=Exiguobacterium sp. UBA5002 TaxID=1946497 RepID=UPI0025C0FE4A|nr:hypothetical protein [Exiguobacterium sp. UBA5002]
MLNEKNHDLPDEKADLPDEKADVGLHPDPDPAETSDPGIKPAETQHPDPDPEELERDRKDS